MIYLITCTRAVIGKCVNFTDINYKIQPNMQHTGSVDSVWCVVPQSDVWLPQRRQYHSVITLRTNYLSISTLSTKINMLVNAYWKKVQRKWSSCWNMSIILSNNGSNDAHGDLSFLPLSQSTGDHWIPWVTWIDTVWHKHNKGRHTNKHELMTTLGNKPKTVLLSHYSPQRLQYHSKPHAGIRNTANTNTKP